MRLRVSFRNIRLKFQSTLKIIHRDFVRGAAATDPPWQCSVLSAYNSLRPKVSSSLVLQRKYTYFSNQNCSLLKISLFGSGYPIQSFLRYSNSFHCLSDPQFFTVYWATRFSVLQQSRSSSSVRCFSTDNTSASSPPTPSSQRESLPKTDSKDEIQIPEPPTNCCMSGCANCVWITYALELAQLYKDSGKAAESVMNAIDDPSLKVFLNLELKEKLNSDSED